MKRGEKLTEPLKTTVTDRYADAFRIISEMEGYETPAHFLRDLVKATVDKKIMYMAKLKEVIGEEQFSLSSEGSERTEQDVANFMLVASETIQESSIH